MKLIHFSLAVSAAAAVLSVSTPVSAQTFDAEAAALFMTRSGDEKNTPLVTQGPNTVFETGSVDLGWKPGAEARFGFRPSSGPFGIEVGGFFLGEQSESAAFVGNGGGVTIQTAPTTPYGLPAGSTLTATYKSRIRGLQGAFTYSPDSDVTLFIGPRLVRLTETFNLFGNFPATGTYFNDVWHTRNRMLGAQAGVRTNVFDALGMSVGGLTLDGNLSVSLLRNKISSNRFSRNTVVGPATIDRSAGITDKDLTLGFDVGLDLGYEIAQGVKLFAGYKLMYIRDVAKAVEQVGATGNYTGTGSPTLGLITDDVLYHGFRAGIKIALGRKAEPAPEPVAEAPSPAPAPAPAPEPARNYLVFFDWDSTVLTQASLDIIADAAEAAKAGGSTQIDVTGHADKSGSDEYNLGLSRRRAEVVVAELVRLGVDAGEIAAFAKGETDPLVPTADGVREPQNRRVQIVLN